MPQASRAVTGEQIVLYAQVANVCLGVGLLFWGIAPAIVSRLVTGDAPHWSELTANSVIMVLGMVWLSLFVLMRRDVLWAYWCSFILATLLCGASVAVVTMADSYVSSSFLMLLAATTCFSNWLALGTKARAGAEARDAAEATRQPIRYI